MKWSPGKSSTHLLATSIKIRSLIRQENKEYNCYTNIFECSMQAFMAELGRLNPRDQNTLYLQWEPENIGKNGSTACFSREDKVTTIPPHVQNSRFPD